MRALALLAVAACLAAPARAVTIVSLGFDDNTSSHTLAADILSARGMRGTFYVNSGRVGLPGFLTLTQLRSMAAAGHEIAGHTVDHRDLTTLTAAQRQQQVCDDRSQLQARGFSPVSFAYPFGAFNSGAQTTVEGCGYGNARTVGGLSCAGCPAGEPIPPADAFAIRTPSSVRSDTTLAQMQRWVTAAESSGGGLVPIVMHHVCDGCSELAIAPATLAAFADWLGARGPGTVVRTMREALGAPPPSAPPPGASVSLWTTQGPAASEYSAETSGVNLGTRFRSDLPGQIVALRYYKPGPVAGGPKQGRLWNAATGALLGSVSFPATTTAGWHTVDLASPVSIQAGVDYIVSYHTTSGYAATRDYFATPRDSPPLHGTAGHYLYSATPAMPTRSTGNSNYWADVVWRSAETPPPPPADSTQIFTLWASTEGPTAAQASSDPGPVFLGTRFRTDTPGMVRAIRFFKRASSAGPRTGQLWTSGGTLLGSVDFAVETSTGWQQADFASPIAISSGHNYVVAYRSQTGYAVATQYFTTPRVRGPLTAPAAAPGAGNGLYVYSSAATAFPAQTTNASNYWADVVFSVGGSTAAPANPVPAIAALSPSSATAGSPGLTLTIEGSGFVPGSVARWNGANRTTTFVNSGRVTAALPSSDLATPTTASVTVFNPAPGGGPSNAASFFVTEASTPPPSTGTATTLWTTQGPAANEFYIDPTPVNVGVRFRSDVAGQITGLRFYKVSGNTGAHQGRLWTDTGTLLGSLTFTSETASGWQTATFASPIPIAASTLYVASYHSPTGYAVTRNYFTTSRDNPPLHAPASAPGALNGLYLYSNTPAFPTQSTGASNYWVDVVFNSGSAPAALLGTSALACPGCAAPDLSARRAYPNPWRADQHAGLPMVFDRVPAGTVIQIYTVTGKPLRTLTAGSGSASWDLTVETGERAGSGYYLYRATTPSGERKSGKIAIVR